MSTSVSNWVQDLGDVSVYHDLSSRHMLHYGPCLTWSSLIKQSLGSKFTVLRGELNFEVSIDRINEIKNQFNNAKLLPLVADNISNFYSSSIPINDPHSSNVTLVNSLPFPKVLLSITISHSDLNYNELITKIEKLWSDKIFFEGFLEFNYRSRIVYLSYEIKFLSNGVFQASCRVSC